MSLAAGQADTPAKERGRKKERNKEKGREGQREGKCYCCLYFIIAVRNLKVQI